MDLAQLAALFGFVVGLVAGNLFPVRRRKR